jgi:hypothetical protein
MESRVGKAPIFVVGVPRSGTTLLAAMLGAHSRMSCGTETRFFRFLPNACVDQLCAPESWPENAVDFLYTMKLVDIPVPDHYNLNRQQIYDYLSVQPPSIQNILASLTEQFMIVEEKSRWVEKSPEHLMYVNNIRNYFPESPIVRIIRDPRDVALSLIKTPWAPQDFLEAIIYWRIYDENSARFFKSDANCYTIYYENLIQSPEIELKKLCEFLGEDYEDQMLDTSRSAANIVTKKDSWHRIVDKPVDLSRLFVWKNGLTQDINRVAEALIGDRLETYGYERVENFDRFASVYPELDMLLNFRESLASLVGQGFRFWRSGYEHGSHLKVYVGEPDKDKWLSEKKPERWWETFHLITEMLREKLAHQQIYWVRNQDVKMDLGYCSRMLNFVLLIVGERNSV